MPEISELVKALRCKRDDCEGCELAFFDKDDDAADAIERLIAERDEAKTDLAAVGRAFIREIEQHEPKRGKWIYKPKDAIEMMFTLPKCSVCGHESSDANNYCPNCGAKMEVQE